MPIPPRTRLSSTDALSGIWTILLATFVIGALYFGRDILIPIALATLFTFLLSPLVTRLQRWIGRIGAVLAVVLLLLALVAGGGWVLTRQLVDLAVELPSYKENISSKLRSINMTDGPFTRLFETVDELKEDIPGSKSGKEKEEKKAAEDPTPFSLRPTREAPMQVEIIDTPDPTPAENLRSYGSVVAGPLGTAALVFLLLIFMLLKREDLRSRFIRLIGQGRISGTARAMDDAGHRVSRYLLMLLVVNVTYGIPVAIGLYFIGVPNAILWGTLCIFLRFIPYVGPWVGAAFPIILSIIISPDWVMPIMTISMFIVLELISNNVMEPWLYGASTGVTPVALIVAAVVWTWMWGPVGLVLATPFTVCLVVMGRHIPRLSFLSVMLSDEEALTPAEDCYHRLLRAGEHDEMELVDNYLRSHSFIELYDRVLVPVIVAAETDHRTGLLEADQRSFVFQGLRDIEEDLAHRPPPPKDGDETHEEPLRPDCRVHFVPARAERDELAAILFSGLLVPRGVDVSVGSGKPSAGEKALAAQEARPDIVCVSAVAPTSVTQVRFVCQRVRHALPDTKIVVGFWSAPERIESAADTLREAGADEIVSTFTEAEETFIKLVAPLAMKMEAAALPEDEDERLRSMAALELGTQRLPPALQPLVLKMAHVFEVETAMVSSIDRKRQVFLSHSGLPQDLADSGEIDRETSICGHVIEADGILVIGDLARDRRFANNPLVKDNGLRFYAGAPLRTPDGRPFGTLCLIGLSPRRFTGREIRLLETYAIEISEMLAPMASSTESS